MTQHNSMKLENIFHREYSLLPQHIYFRIKRKVSNLLGKDTLINEANEIMDLMMSVRGNVSDKIENTTTH